MTIYNFSTNHNMISIGCDVKIEWLKKQQKLANSSLLQSDFLPGWSTTDQKMGRSFS